MFHSAFKPRLILIGEDAETIAQELGALTAHEPAADLEDAVQRAFLAAENGDTVLLAPACSSFDQFQNFEHRGGVFKQLVNRLGPKE